eukprot:656997-Pleurochrysis_carterae.AAC.1
MMCASPLARQIAWCAVCTGSAKGVALATWLEKWRAARSPQSAPVGGGGQLDVARWMLAVAGK